MNKREEIREILMEDIGLYLSEEHSKQLVSDILLDLHSKGVVIKVDRELPDSIFMITVDGKKVSDKVAQRVVKSAQVMMLEAGYVAVEPIVEN